MTYGIDLDDKKDATQAERERAERVAKEKGCVCVYPAADELFLDIDNFEAYGRFEANRKTLGYMIRDVNVAPSRSGAAGRYHITVRLTRPVKDRFERVMLQLLLGSDLTRELMSFLRADRGAMNPTVFFEKPPAVPSPDDTSVFTTIESAPSAPSAGGSSRDY